MKPHYFLLLLACLGLASCTCPRPGGYYEEAVMLVIDRQSNQFVGGYRQPAGAWGDELALEVEYQAPGDFGRITFRDKESKALLFDATMAWMGKGARTFPIKLSREHYFSPTPAFAPLPRFENVFPNPGEAGEEPIDYEAIWSAVSSLEIVWQSLKADPGQTVYLSIYTPTHGLIDPAAQQWLIFMHNKSFMPGE